DTLHDYSGSQGGLIQVDGAEDGSGTGSTLNLQNTIIDGNSLASAVFTVKGKLDATDIGGTGTSNTIENFTTAGNFSNGGEILVTSSVVASGSTLTLKNDVLNDYRSSQGGLIQVDGGSTLELQTTVIDGGSTLGTPPSPAAVLTIDGQLTVDSGAADNTTENFGAG